MSPRQQLQLVVGRVEANRGGIVLFHDTKKQTAAMLPSFLRLLKKGGYRICMSFPQIPDGVCRLQEGSSSSIVSLQPQAGFIAPNRGH
jgi:hypothetical protein